MQIDLLNIRKLMKRSRYVALVLFDVKSFQNVVGVQTPAFSIPSHSHSHPHLLRASFCL